MKRNVIALFTGVFACALLFVGCGDSAPAPRQEDPIKYWEGDACPITGKKYSSADPNDSMAGNVPLEFEHEGQKYQANVWDEAAISEFTKNPDKYRQKIIDGSK